MCSVLTFFGAGSRAVLALANRRRIRRARLIQNAWTGFAHANHVRKVPMKSAFAVLRLVTSRTGLG